MKAIILDVKDNVATVMEDLKAGEMVELKVGTKTLMIKLISSVPFGHKFSLIEIARGSPVIKYGENIGLATADIHPGDYVHIHNVVSSRGRGDLAGGSK